MSVRREKASTVVLDVIPVDSEVILANRREIRALLDEAFDGSELNGFEPGRPWEHTLQVALDDRTMRFRHLLIFEAAKGLVGGCFAVPVRGGHVDPLMQDPANRPGWFCTTRALRPYDRFRAVDQLLSHAHTTMSTAGFERICVDMGTSRGAAYLRSYHAYTSVDVDGESMWERPLATMTWRRLNEFRSSVSKYSDTPDLTQFRGGLDDGPWF